MTRVSTKKSGIGGFDSFKITKCCFPFFVNMANCGESSVPCSCQWPTVCELPKQQLTLQGYSRGSHMTSFYIPQLRLFFDAGIHSLVEPKYIFITHAHIDHWQALPANLSGVKSNPKIYAPIESRERMEAMLNASYHLAKHTDRNCKYPVLGTEPGQIISLDKGYEMHCFRLDHNVPTCGYGLMKTKTKLKPEFTGSSQKDIVQAKQSGLEVMQLVSEPVLAFVTDTSIKAFEINPDLLRFPAIVVECTFLEPDDLQTAIESQHIHWSQLKPIVQQHPHVTFLLIHFSMRYKTSFIRQFFAQEPKPDNVQLLL